MRTRMTKELRAALISNGEANSRIAIDLAMLAEISLQAQLNAMNGIPRAEIDYGNSSLELITARARAEVTVDEERKFHAEDPPWPPEIAERLSQELDVLVHSISNLSKAYADRRDGAFIATRPTPGRPRNHSANALEAAILGLEFRPPKKRGRKPPLGIDIPIANLLDVADSAKQAGFRSQRAALQALAEELLRERSKRTIGKQLTTQVNYMRRRVAEARQAIRKSGENGAA